MIGTCLHYARGRTRRCRSSLGAVLALVAIVLLATAWVRSLRAVEGLELDTFPGGLTTNEYFLLSSAGGISFHKETWLLRDGPRKDSRARLRYQHGERRSFEEDGGFLGFHVAGAAPPPFDVLGFEVRAPYWFPIVVCALMLLVCARRIEVVGERSRRANRRGKWRAETGGRNGKGKRRDKATGEKTG